MDFLHEPGLGRVNHPLHDLLLPVLVQVALPLEGICGSI